MKQIMITTAAMALAFSAPTFAAADSNTAKGPGSAAAADKSIAKVDTNIDVTKKTNIDVTKTTQVDVTKLNLTNAFNKTTVVNATKLDGYVSGNTIHDVGNIGGYATNSGSTGDGGVMAEKPHHPQCGLGTMVRKKTSWRQLANKHHRPLLRAF